MATLPAPPTFSSDGGHWYTASGVPCHRIAKANGDGERNTTLRDAKKLNLFPSVTTVLSILDKQQLGKWKQEQVANAAYEWIKSGAEMPAKADFIKALIANSFQSVTAAADLGTSIHDALNAYFTGEEVPLEYQDYTNPVIEWMKEAGVHPHSSEQTLVNKEYGYAGTIDFAGIVKCAPVVYDFKTRKTKPGEPCKPRDHEPMQIAAYAKAYWGDQFPKVWGANLYISTTEPGRMEVVRYNPAKVQAEWQKFEAILGTWRLIKNYDPRA